MNVLLTGGNAALQHSIADACVAAGHSVCVVLTAPHASANPWPAQVEPVDPDATPETLRELARQCDTAVAVSPALSLSLRASHEATIARTLEAAALAGIRRLVLLTGLNDRSALRPNGFPIDCLVIRTAPPYGVTDDLITLFLIMMRSLPVVPLLPDSSVMSPIWHEDLARCVAASLALPSNRTATVMTVTGPDAITSRELYERLARQIDRHPLRVTIPDFFARQVGLDRSVDTDSDGRTLAPFAELVRTRLDEGLQRMIRQLAEVTPEEGVGGLQLKTFSTTIAVATSASAVMSLLRTRFADMMPVPVGTEPAVPTQTLSEGSVLTIALPGRGHVQVRVVESEATQTTLATLRGHSVAGIVQFRTVAVPGGVSFQITTCDRAANAADWMALSLGAARLQDANWTTVVKKVAVAAGEPDAPNVRVDSKRLWGAEARQWEGDIADLLRGHHERVARPATSSRT